MKVLSNRRYPGPAFDELDDVEVQPLASLGRPRFDVEGVIVANDPVPLDLLPNLRVVANFGVGYDRIDVAACADRGVVVTKRPVSSTTPPPTWPSRSSSQQDGRCSRRPGSPTTGPKARTTA